MTQDLIATVLPDLGQDAYAAAIANADRHRLATAAFNARYAGDFGRDETFAQAIRERMSAADPGVIELLAAHPGAIEAIRNAARAGAQWIAGRARHFDKFMVHTADTGAGDFLVVGASTHGNEPFDDYPNVVLLAALLTAMLPVAHHVASPLSDDTDTPLWRTGLDLWGRAVVGECSTAFGKLDVLPDDDRIRAINAIRTALQRHWPTRDEPLGGVL